MRPSRHLSHAVVAAGLISGAVCSVLPAASATAADGQAKTGHDSFAVIGDVPYGADQVAAFPHWVDQINADPDVSFAFHVGDIKNGSTRCDDSYFQMVRAQLDRFEDPLVYTPGDNEWTDCHRTNNGAYNPLERLAAVRDTFFAKPGQTLGRSVRVSSQADEGLPENVSLRRDGLSMAALHVVGSNNDLQPWTGIGQTSATPQQVAEERHRMAATIDLVRQTFVTAKQRHDRAVVLFQQADMFDPSYTPTPEDISAFTPLVQALVDEASRFDGPVYLFNGDSHTFNADRPLAPGSSWLERYGVQGSAANLQRVTVDGSSNNKDWLKVSVNRPGNADVLSWERVPYSG